MKIFLISGKARSGKDTFATSLQKILEKKNYKVCRLQVGAYITKTITSNFRNRNNKKTN